MSKFPGRGSNPRHRGDHAEPLTQQATRELPFCFLKRFTYLRLFLEHTLQLTHSEGGALKTSLSRAQGCLPTAVGGKHPGPPGLIFWFQAGWQTPAGTGRQGWGVDTQLPQGQGEAGRRGKGGRPGQQAGLGPPSPLPGGPLQPCSAPGLAGSGVRRSCPHSPHRRGGVERCQVLPAGGPVVLPRQALSHLRLRALQVPLLAPPARPRQLPALQPRGFPVNISVYAETDPRTRRDSLKYEHAGDLETNGAAAPGPVTAPLINQSVRQGWGVRGTVSGGA